MQNTASESAMTEVALALAMGFFSLMVLTLISMGVEAKNSDGAENKSVRILDLVTDEASTSAVSSKLNEKDIVLFFDGQNYRNSDLTTADIHGIVKQANASGNRIILAVDPNISFEAVMMAREKLAVVNLVVSPYSAEWQRTLSSRLGGKHDQ